MRKRLSSREKRAKLIRKKIAEQLTTYRLSVHKSSQHIYAQLLSCDGSTVIASASSLDKEGIKVCAELNGKLAKAAEIGRLIAERALAKGISQVAFDRSGFKYHGRIKSLAESARNAGLVF